VRHDPGLAASPPARYTLRVARSALPPCLSLFVRWGRTTSLTLARDAEAMTGVVKRVPPGRVVRAAPGSTRGHPQPLTIPPTPTPGHPGNHSDEPDITTERQSLGPRGDQQAGWGRRGLSPSQSLLREPVAAKRVLRGDASRQLGNEHYAGSPVTSGPGVTVGSRFGTGARYIEPV